MAADEPAALVNTSEERGKSSAIPGRVGPFDAEEFQRRKAVLLRFVEWRGLRGQDAEAVAAELLVPEKETLELHRATAFDARSAVRAFCRGEARRHDHEVESFRRRKAALGPQLLSPDRARDLRRHLVASLHEVSAHTPRVVMGAFARRILAGWRADRLAAPVLYDPHDIALRWALTCALRRRGVQVTEFLGCPRVERILLRALHFWEIREAPGPMDRRPAD